jgi:hypothetical protein
VIDKLLSVLLHKLGMREESSEALGVDYNSKALGVLLAVQTLSTYRQKVSLRDGRLLTLTATEAAHMIITESLLHPCLALLPLLLSMSSSRLALCLGHGLEKSILPDVACFLLPLVLSSDSSVPQ